MKKYFYLTTALLLSVFSACTEDTGSIGFYPPNENIETSTATIWGIKTSSMAMDSVIAKSSKSYLGSIFDPETHSLITADFATQLGIVEGLEYFPDKDSITSRDEFGNPVCDSVLLQLNFDDYIGDSGNPLKVAVYPVDKNNPLSEDSTYFADTDLTKYIDPSYKDNPLTTHVLTAWDRAHGSNPDDKSGTYSSLRIPIPNEQGNSIMNAYWQYVNDNNGLEPSQHVNKNFDDSYHFIHNVFPGYIVRISNGNGCLVSLFVDKLFLCFDMKVWDEEKECVKEIATNTVFAGTNEVIQTCRFNHSNIDELVAMKDTTWLKTPAGICTEIEFPIDTVYFGLHENDSVNNARLVIPRYNRQKQQSIVSLPITQKILLVRKDNMYKYFKENHVPDDVLSYVATYDQTYNCYSFSNISQLFSTCRSERDRAINRWHMGQVLQKRNVIPDNVSIKELETRVDEWLKNSENTQEFLSEVSRWRRFWRGDLYPLASIPMTADQAGTSSLNEMTVESDYCKDGDLSIHYMWKKWNLLERNANWNKFCLVPVETNTDTSTGKITSLNHDLSVSSARLVRGTGEKNNPIQMQVYYSRTAVD